MDEQDRLELVAATLDQLPLPIAITRGDDQRLVAMNASGRATFGERPLDEPATRWLPGLLGQHLLDRYAETWRSGRTFVDRDLTIAPVRHEDGSVRAVVCIGQDAAGPARPDPLGIVAQLQDAMLPKGLPVPQGVEVAARYLLAEHGVAGGDWFDAIALPDGRVVVVVGDVVGQGVEASTAMGGLRALFEERVREDGDVLAALALLDRRAARLDEARGSTMCTCVVDPAAGHLEYVTAGHPPPVLVTTADGATYLPPTGAGPLGSGLPLLAARHRLAVGDLLLLYSDGLVERPGRTPAQNTIDLLGVVGDTARAASAEQSVEQSVEHVCRQTLEALIAGSGYADDISILALELVPPVAPLELALPAVPDSVRVVRTELDQWLAGLRASAVDRLAVQHAVGELVSNVVEHAYASVDVANPLSVRVFLTPDGQVDLTVADRGRWREPGPALRGRGLAMARSFLDELELSHDVSGTCAHGRHRMSCPATLLRGSGRSARDVHRAVGRVEVVGDALRVSGRVDLRSAGELRNALARASLGGVRPVTVDLAEVEVLSSAAVQALYEARAVGPVALAAPMGSPAQRVLDLVGLPREDPAT